MRYCDNVIQRGDQARVKQLSKYRTHLHLGAAPAYELPQRTETAAENMPAASSPQGDHMQLWTQRDDADGRDGAAPAQGDQSWPAPRDDADDAPPPRWDPRGVDEALLPLSYALLPLSSSWPGLPFHAGSWAGHRVAW